MPPLIASGRSKAGGGFNVFDIIIAVLLSLFAGVTFSKRRTHVAAVVRARARNNGEKREKSAGAEAKLPLHASKNALLSAADATAARKRGILLRTG